MHTTTIKNATRKELKKSSQLHQINEINLKINKNDKAVKLHRQFSHASKEKLCKLLKPSLGFDNDEFLDIVKEQCDLCEAGQKFKRPPSRLPLADNFNQVACMDLKEYIHNKVRILHLIDAATRYSAECLIRTKHPD